MRRPLIDETTMQYLTERYEISKSGQQAAGVQFSITFIQYLGLWKAKPRHVRRLSNTIRRGTVDGFMRSKDGFVLTWLDGRPKPVMDTSNSDITTKTVSRKRSQFKKGDRHSEASKEKIRLSKTGKPFKDNDTRKARISEAMRGKPQTDEAKAARSVAAKAYWARKRAEKEAAEIAAVVGTPTLDDTQQHRIEEVSAQLVEVTNAIEINRQAWDNVMNSVPGFEAYTVDHLDRLHAEETRLMQRRTMLVQVLSAGHRGECMVMARLQWDASH